MNKILVLILTVLSISFASYAANVDLVKRYSVETVVRTIFNLSKNDEIGIYIAQLYEYGKEDFELAASKIEQEAFNGDHIAQTALAIIYSDMYNYDTIEHQWIDIEKAIHWAKLSAENGVRNAAELLVSLYFEKKYQGSEKKLAPLVRKIIDTKQVEMDDFLVEKCSSYVPTSVNSMYVHFLESNITDDEIELIMDFLPVPGKVKRKHLEASAQHIELLDKELLVEQDIPKLKALISATVESKRLIKSLQQKYRSLWPSLLAYYKRLQIRHPVCISDKHVEWLQKYMDDKVWTLDRRIRDDDWSISQAEEAIKEIQKNGKTEY